jgi:hypothetical protein
MSATAGNVLTFVAAEPWTRRDRATPLYDLRCVQVFARGAGHRCGRESRAYMSPATFAALRDNANHADLFGRRVNDVARTLAGVFADDDLPVPVECRPYDAPPDGRAVVLPPGADAPAFGPDYLDRLPPGAVVMCV